MGYVALKPCSFAGQSFKINDAVPDSVIHPGAAKNLVKMQIIAPVGDVDILSQPSNFAPPQNNSSIRLTLRVEEGDLPLDVTTDGIQNVFDVLTTNVDDAESIIEGMTDGDALILLHVSDSRKTIKAAAEARAKAINESNEEPELPEESEGEQ